MLEGWQLSAARHTSLQCPVEGVECELGKRGSDWFSPEGIVLGLVENS